MLADIALVRDWVIIIVGFFAAILLFFTILFTVVIGVATRTLISITQNLLENEVRPLAQSARQTASRVKGTAQFISETVVTPTARVYGAIAGVRRAIGVVSGISRRGRRGGG